MREPLPIDAALDSINAALHRSQAIIIVAEPGAGKTTRVPPALLEFGPALVLQPRRAAARSIARYIASENGWTIGREVGWHIRLESLFSRETRLLMATEGILTARLQHDPLLCDFSTIVLDEFHERSIHADLAIALSRQALAARSDLRLVVMSATIDADRVAHFLGDCPIVRVPGRQFPVRTSYHPALGVADAVEQIQRETDGDILCFQPGAVEIHRTVEDLRARLPHVAILPLYGSLPSSEQDLVLTPDTGRRRVIVCTNIAETSLTVPGVTGVVDAGLEKVARYDAERAIDRLMTERITQAAAEQRAGRAGRTGPGVVYRLWNPTDRLRPFREPEIHRIDLSGAALDVAAWGGDPRTLDWLERPRADGLDAALALLNRMGALSGVRLTDVGREMIRFPLPSRLARVAVASGGDLDILRAVSILAERYPAEKRPAQTSSDLLPTLDDWALAPAPVKGLAEQLVRIGRAQRNRAPATLDRERSLRRALLTGYPDRVAQCREPHSSRFLMSTGTGAIAGDQTGVRSAEYLIALDIQGPSRAGDVESRIRMASAIEREWLTPTSTDVEYHIDERGVVRAREVERYDALVLKERPVAPDRERAADLLATEWLARPLSEMDLQTMRRIRFAGIEVDLPAVIRDAAYGARRLEDISLAASLSRDVVRALERQAPDTLMVPSGRRVALDYADDGTVSASVKLQELFGLADTPRIGPRGEPLLFALLAPNGRPVQLTRDLKSFWNRTYREVRKELRGRYPKHPWPDDPWNAPPTHRTTRRSG